MKIGIVGAGAIGCIFGAFLSKTGQEVWLVDVWKEHVNRINRDGLTLTRPGGHEETIAVKATDNPAAVGICDLVIFLVKAYDTAAAARGSVPMVGPDTYALTVQNGIGNLEAIIAGLEMERVLYGATVLTGKMSGPRHVLLSAPLGSRVVVQIGEYGNRISARLEEVAAVFQQAGLRTEISDHPDVYLWSKVAGSCALAPLDVIGRIRHGDVVAQEEGRELVFNIIDEVVRVANLKGIKLNTKELNAQIIAICQQTRDHYASMLSDVLNHRRTEIDSFNAAIAREAESMGIAAPLNRALAKLIKLIEKTYSVQIR